MTGPLKNARHERFVALLLEGKSATEAYEAAGFKRDDANAARLKARPDVVERLTELQNEVAAKVPITIESLISELEEVRTAATSKSQYAAAVRAVLGKAQLAGLLVERSKVEVEGNLLNRTKYDSDEDIVDGMLQVRLNWYHDLRDEDRQKVLGLFQQCFADVEAVVDEIKARPYITTYEPPKSLPPPHANGRSRS
jgi:hypothetical protein